MVDWKQQLAEFNFELECLPRPGELIVCMVDRYKKEMGLSLLIGGRQAHRVPWSAWRSRYRGPYVYSETPHCGDMGVIVDAKTGLA